jgi:hypothetical protein
MLLPGFTPAPGSEEDFDRFWAVFPRKEAKKDARVAWNKLAPPPSLVDRMLAALAWQAISEQWTKEGGQFIPLPASWLRGERWTDEQPQAIQRGPVVSQKTATVLRAAANVMARRRQEGF